ncbi:hypothetical protein HDU85_005441 [Gaertneriomyces sp. JEL0708]|nr:hypothetical protein HDU85_005441 [Gaertneriomyces sp. JEL0708]
MSTRTEQVLQRKAEIDSQKAAQTTAHLEKAHSQATLIAQQACAEKAQAAKELLANQFDPAEHVRKSEELLEQKRAETLRDLEERSLRANEIVQEHLKGKAKHAAEVGTHRKSLENVAMKKDDDEQKRLELLRDLEEKAIRAELLKNEKMKEIREKAASYDHLDEVGRRRHEEEQRKQMETLKDLERKAEQAERVRKEQLEKVKEKARALDRPFATVEP